MDSDLRRLLQGDDALMTSFLDTTPPRAPEGYGNLRGSKAFVPLAHVGLNNATQRHNLQHATTSCLLYTSPSPRDVEESRMPSSA